MNRSLYRNILFLASGIIGSILLILALYPLELVIRVNGRVKPFTTTVTNEDPLVIQQWLVSHGNVVEEGEKIVRLNTDTLKEQLRKAVNKLGVIQSRYAKSLSRRTFKSLQAKRLISEAQNELAQARTKFQVQSTSADTITISLRKTELQMAKQELKQAKRNLEQKKELHAANSISDQVLEKARNTVKRKRLRVRQAKLRYRKALNPPEKQSALAEARLQGKQKISKIAREELKKQKELAQKVADVTKSELDIAQNKVERLQEKVDSPVIRAPIDGVVQLPTNQQGAILPAGTKFPPGKTIFRMAPRNMNRIVSWLPEKLYPEFEPGAEVSIKWVGKKEEFSGSIQHRSRRVDQTTDPLNHNTNNPIKRHVFLSIKSTKDLIAGASIKIEKTYYYGPAIGIIYYAKQIPFELINWRFL